MPVSLGVASMSQVSNLVHIPDFLEKMLAEFTEGGITTILPALEKQDKRLGGK